MNRRYLVTATAAGLAVVALGVAPAAQADSTPWGVTDSTSQNVPPGPPSGALTGAAIGAAVAAPAAPVAPAATPAPSPANPSHPQGWPQGWTVTGAAPTPAARVAKPSSGQTTPRRVARFAPARRAPQHATARVARRATTPTPVTRGPWAAVSTSGTWTVMPGDTLSEIAAVNHTTVGALVAANARRHPSLLTNPDLIREGWRLRISGAVR